jgi:hypothetical protein
MHFLGADLLVLLEEVLPARFGGRPTDYQLVEVEEGGITKVTLFVSPSVGDLAEDEVLRTALSFLEGRGPGQRLMAEVWANGETLRISRSEPHVTAAGKIQPLQYLRG